jgi:Helix-turn-helix domain
MRRSYVFRLRPTARQHLALAACVESHRELNNAALQERRDAWAHSKTRTRYGDQSAQLTEIRTARPDRAVWSFSSQQATLRRHENRCGCCYFLPDPLLSLLAAADWALLANPDFAVELLIPSPCTQPRSPISGQHCREAFLQILDEILGNLQRREMSPGFGRPPSDDLSVPLLCPGARTLLDVAGIHTDC